MSDEAATTRAFWDVLEEHIGPAWREKRRLAAALRELISLCVTTDAAAEELASIAEGAERLVARLRLRRGATFGEAMARSIPREELFAFADRSCLVGLSNPVAPPLVLSMEGDVAVGRVTFPPVFEGIPGCVHGGVVAATFDQAFGYLQSKRGLGSVTGRLSVDYLRPTPLLREIRVTARAERTERRKTFVTAQMLAGADLLAEASGVFIALDGRRVTELGERSDGAARGG